MTSDPQIFLFQVLAIILVWEGLIRYRLVDPD